MNREHKQLLGMALACGALVSLVIAGFDIFAAFTLLTWGIVIWIAMSVDDIENRQKQQTKILKRIDLLLNDIEGLDIEGLVKLVRKDEIRKDEI